MKKQKKEANVTKKNLVKLKKKTAESFQDWRFYHLLLFDTGSINDGISISVCY